MFTDLSLVSGEDDLDHPFSNVGDEMAVAEEATEASAATEASPMEVINRRRNASVPQPAVAVAVLTRHEPLSYYKPPPKKTSGDEISISVDDLKDSARGVFAAVRVPPNKTSMVMRYPSRSAIRTSTPRASLMESLQANGSS